jgi:hypothetical protein
MAGHEFHQAEPNVSTALAAPTALIQHPVGLADAGCGPEVDAKMSV